MPIEGWRAKGEGPPFINLTGEGGRGVRYSIDDLKKWIEEQKRGEAL